MNSRMFIDLVKDTPSAYHSNPSDTFAVLLGNSTAAKLTIYLRTQYPAGNWQLNKLYLDCKEEPAPFVAAIGTRGTAILLAALECSRSLLDEKVQQYKRINAAEDAIDYVCDRYLIQLKDIGKEFFYVVLLDIRNKIIKDIEISRGSISASVVDPADIVREVCVHHASRVILVHNHPSGETDPSKEDIDTTNKIVQALMYVGVHVLDHIIVGNETSTFYSFARAGSIPSNLWPISTPLPRSKKVTNR